jgi:hypothetical protein
MRRKDGVKQEDKIGATSWKEQEDTMERTIRKYEQRRNYRLRCDAV